MTDINIPVVDGRTLFELVWSKRLTHVAGHFSTSGAHVRALYDRLNLPVPVQGYWMKLEAGKHPLSLNFHLIRRLMPLSNEVTRPRPRLPRATTAIPETARKRADHPIMNMVSEGSSYEVTDKGQ